MIVSGAGGPAAPLAPRRPAGGAAFRIDDPRDCGRPAGSSAAAPAGVLALQETDAEPARDRAARRRAGRILHELAALQGALLAGAAADEALARLAALAQGLADAADPALRAAADAVILRARIELARAERPR